MPTLATVDIGAPGAYTMFDDPAPAAQEIERLFADEPHWRARSAACRSYFERRYSCESVLAQYGEVFEALAA